MADQSRTPPPSPKPKAIRSAKTALRSVSLSRVQAFVGTLAGLASIVGVTFSLLPLTAAPTTGELVAVVQAAGSRRAVPDATIEVLTTDNAVVATLTPDASGRATQALKEGLYVVRVSHPRYAPDVRRIQVQPRQTIELTASLRAGSSSPVERAVNDGVSAVRKALRF